MNWLLMTGIPIVLSGILGYLLAYQHYRERRPNLTIVVPEGTPEQAVAFIANRVAEHEGKRGSLGAPKDAR